MANQYTKAAERNAQGLPPIPRAPRPALQAPVAAPAKPKRIRRTRAQIEAARAHAEALRSPAVTLIDAPIAAPAKPSMYRPWMGGVVLGLVMVAMVWSLLAAHKQIQVQASEIESLRETVDSLVAIRGLPEINSQEAYDALPMYTRYTSQGKTYVKGIRPVTPELDKSKAGSRRKTVAPTQAVPQGAVAPDAPATQANHSTDTAAIGG